MTKSTLSQFLDLANEDVSDVSQGGQDPSEFLPAPTLDDRANLYLSAVYGMHEFNNDEYAAARTILLDAMAANVGPDVKSVTTDEAISTNPTKLGSGEA